MDDPEIAMLDILMISKDPGFAVQRLECPGTA
jgi:hypothetical protein